MKSRKFKKFVTVLTLVISLIAVQTLEITAMASTGTPDLSNPAVVVSDMESFFNAVSTAEDGTVIGIDTVIYINAGSYQIGSEADPKHLYLVRKSGNAGIYITNTANLTIYNMTIDGNRSSVSGDCPMFTVNGALNLHYSTVQNFDTLGEKGTIYVADSASFFSVGTTYTNNAASVGGHIVSAGNTRLNGCALTNGSGREYGGAIHVSSGTTTIENCKIIGNQAGNWGGGINNAGGSVTVSQSVIYNNTANYGSDIANDVNSQFQIDSLEDTMSLYEEEGISPVAWVFDGLDEGESNSAVTDRFNVSDPYALMKLSCEDESAGGNDDSGNTEDGGSSDDNTGADDGTGDTGDTGDSGNTEDGGTTGDGDNTGDAEDSGNTEDSGTSDDTGNTEDGGNQDDTGNTEDGGDQGDTGSTEDGGNQDDSGSTEDSGSSDDTGSDDSGNGDSTGDDSGTTDGSQDNTDTGNGDGSTDESGDNTDTGNQDDTTGDTGNDDTQNGGSSDDTSDSASDGNVTNNYYDQSSTTTNNSTTEDNSSVTNNTDNYEDKSSSTTTTTTTNNYYTYNTPQGSNTTEKSGSTKTADSGNTATVTEKKAETVSGNSTSESANMQLPDNLTLDLHGVDVSYEIVDGVPKIIISNDKVTEQAGAEPTEATTRTMEQQPLTDNAINTASVTADSENTSASINWYEIIKMGLLAAILIVVLYKPSAKKGTITAVD